ncbi:MAG: type II secretion system protein [Clostridia bacterium]|nr:type II secretion system protein [Clostridia bacterium]
MRTSLRATPCWRPSKPSESGMTLVELMIAVVLAILLVGAAFTYVQVGMSANARVSNQARYSQGLALAANEILDGSGSEFRGMRAASSISVRSGGGYEFHYSGAISSHTESYWVSNGYVYRSSDGGAALQMTMADSLSIDLAGASGFYVVSLTMNVGSGNTVQYSTRARLRNRAK